MRHGPSSSRRLLSNPGKGAKLPSARQGWRREAREFNRQVCRGRHGMILRLKNLMTGSVRKKQKLTARAKVGALLS